jgi:hypothetical protein
VSPPLRAFTEDIQISFPLLPLPLRGAGLGISATARMRRALSEVGGVRAQGDTQVRPSTYILLPSFSVGYGMMRVRRSGLFYPG